MANMLLDDTTTISTPTKRIAVHRDAQQNKNLPQLPPDDAWAQTTEHVVTAAGEISQSFNYAEQSTSKFFDSVEQSTPPPIPRRVSVLNATVQAVHFK